MHKETTRDRGRKRSVGREALGAALLLGALIFLFSRMPDTTDGYRRARLANYMCDSVDVQPGTPQCVAVSVGGWFAIVVTLGIVLKVGRTALKAAGLGRDTS